MSWAVLIGTGHLILYFKSLKSVEEVTPELRAIFNTKYYPELGEVRWEATEVEMVHMKDVADMPDALLIGFRLLKSLKHGISRMIVVNWV